MASHRLLAGAALVFLASAPTLARSPFDGDWVANLDTQSGLPTDSYLVRDGVYACDTCKPPRRFAADGRPHAVTGDLNVTSEAVTITGPRAIVTRIIGPALDRITTMTVAQDGRTAEYVSVDRRPGISAALQTEYLARRIAPAPPGAHPVSGSWKGLRYTKVPELLRTTTLRVAGDEFNFSTPLGTSYRALLGGGYAPVRSPVAGVFVAVRRVGARRIEARVKQGGRHILTRSFTVSPDGRSMEIATTDAGTGGTFRARSRLAQAKD